MFRKFFKNYYAVSMVSIVVGIIGLFLFSTHGILRFIGICIFFERINIMFN